MGRAWKVTSHFHHYAVTSLPCVKGRFGWSRERRGAFLQGVEGTTYQEDLVMLLNAGGIDPSEVEEEG